MHMMFSFNERKYSYGAVRSFLLVAVLLISTFIPLSGSSEETDVDEQTRTINDTPVGDWSKLSGSGGWPEEISSDNSFIVYRDLSNEIVVIRRGSEDYETWSYFEDNETWVRWNTSGDDPSRSWYLKAFTSNTNGSMAYLYGGYRQSSNYWEYLNILSYDNMTWMEIAPHPNLTARYYSEMVYDDATDSVWIFGGRASSGRQRDLFQYNSTHGWTEHPSINISGEERDQMLLTISPDGEDIYMAIGRYSGWGGGGTWHNDLWHYDVVLQNWTELNDDLGTYTDGGAVFQYRADTDDLFLSLGFTGSSELNNTYIIDPVTGNATQVNLTGGIPGRHVQAWDLKGDGRTVMIFGDDDGTEDIWTMDIYTYSTSLEYGNLEWEGGSAFTGYDPEDGGKLMALKYLGGSNWELVYFSLTDKDWVFLNVSDQNTPTFHDGMANAYDPVKNIFYLYGGLRWYEIDDDWYCYHYDEFSKLDCDTGNWTIINEHGPPGERGRAAMVIDEENRNLYLHGGQIAGGASDSLYKYNITGNVWTSLNPTTKPQGRREHSVEFHSQKNGFYLFGGRLNGTSTAELNDLWFYHTDSKLWEKLPTGDDGPSMQNWAGLSVNTDTDELMLYGDKDDETFLWRDEWRGWKSVATPHRPGGWSGHGQAYSSHTKTHFVWAGDGTEVWEFNPILRTTAVQIMIYDPDGGTSGTSAIPVFPSLGAYKMKIVGTTDMPESDLLGLVINLTIGEEEAILEWTIEGNVLNYEGNESWFIFPDDPTIEFPGEGKWNITIPIEFTFDIPNDVTVRAKATPVTEIGYPETAQRSSLFTMNSQLEIISYSFRSPIQEDPQIGSWLYGRTNLTVYDFRIAFYGYPSIYPAGGTLFATLENDYGDIDRWDYVANQSAELTIPIRGKDKDIITFYLNLSDGVENIKSISFNFKLDLDGPVINGAAIKENLGGEKAGVSKNEYVYITWESITENGAGFEGVCYSLDENHWPLEDNLTAKFREILIKDEGDHVVYMWALDKAGRMGPYIEAPILVDTHRVYFENHIPVKRVNSTEGTHTFTVTAKDDVSGVDHDSLYYRKSTPDLSLSDWIKYDIESGVSRSINLTLTLDLVPGIINLITFKANDAAENGERNSETFIVHYDPDLGTPRALLEEPIGGSEVKGKIELAWDGDYIEPDELSYEVHVIAPDGEDRTFPTEDMSIQFTPDIPGEYRWYVVSIVEGKTNTSEEFSFWYRLDLAVVDLPSLTIIEKGSDAGIEVKIEDTLDIDLVLTIILEVDRDFTITGDNEFPVLAGETVKYDLVLNSSAVGTGTHTLVLNITDNYGRSMTMELKIRVDPKKIDGSGEEQDEGLSTLMLIAIIVGAIVLLAVLLMVILVVRARKHELDDENEPDRFLCKHCGKMIDKDDETCPHCGMLFSDGSMKDGEYNPEGIVKKKGMSVESAVPMAPGMLDNNNVTREGSNVMEMELPVPSTEEIHGEDPLQDPPEETEE
ncbi:MAG: kelch repeat-containing protein [Candidatus Thermoplasmatota archaeon]|nr:kelch repeat-containing protein [Candidatus Thermoplasmatota archaeon]